MEIPTHFVNMPFGSIYRTDKVGISLPAGLLIC